MSRVHLGIEQVSQERLVIVEPVRLAVPGKGKGVREKIRKKTYRQSPVLGGSPWRPGTGQGL